MRRMLMIITMEHLGTITVTRIMMQQHQDGKWKQPKGNIKKKVNN